MTKTVAKLYTFHGHTFYFGRLPNIKEHAHHALQIQIGLEESFKVITRKDTYECRFAILPSNVPHRIDDNDSLQVIIYLEPELEISRILKHKYYLSDEIKKLDIDIISPYIEKLQKIRKEDYNCHGAKETLDAILASLIGDYSLNQSLDKRIQVVMEFCKQAPNKKISASVLAKKVNLSESRLRHLFKEQVGTPIRRYLLWLRLTDALMELSKGGSFTDAAHHAGFSDSAHLSRTYREMYGNSLYDLARNSQFIQAIPCY